MRTVEYEVKKARQMKMLECLSSLSSWCKSMAEKHECSTETTMSMLVHKLKNIEHRVNQAGWKAASEFNNK